MAAVTVPLMLISREYARTVFADLTQNAMVPLDPDELLHMRDLAQYDYVLFGDVAVRAGPSARRMPMAGCTSHVSYTRPFCGRRQVMRSVVSCENVGGLAWSACASCGSPGLSGGARRSC